MQSLAWTIRLLETAKRDLQKLDRTTADRIDKFLRDRLSSLLDPREIGEPLAGNMRGHWRYRVGDYRIICNIQDRELIVLVIKIGHRREVYR